MAKCSKDSSTGMRWASCSSSVSCLNSAEPKPSPPPQGSRLDPLNKTGRPDHKSGLLSFSGWGGRLFCLGGVEQLCSFHASISQQEMDKVGRGTDYGLVLASGLTVAVPITSVDVESPWRVRKRTNGVISNGIFSYSATELTGLDLSICNRPLHGSILTRPPSGSAAVNFAACFSEAGSAED